jgi:hypothetical protein
MNFQKSLSMYKSNIFQKKDEASKYSINGENFSPPYISKLKSKVYYNTNSNNNILKYKLINLYFSYYSPAKTDKNYPLKA